MIHHSLPQTKTTAQLSEWIQEHKIDIINHVTKIDYTPEEIHDFEHQIANNNAAIMELEQLKKLISETIKKGTSVKHLNDKDVEYLPEDFTVPPTKGLDALKSNIEYLVEKIQRGYREDVTTLYLIPVPETQMIVSVDIEGEEYPDHTKPMTSEQQVQYSTLFGAPVDVPIMDVASEPKKQKKAPAAFGDELEDLFPSN